MSYIKQLQWTLMKGPKFIWMIQMSETQADKNFDDFPQ